MKQLLRNFENISIIDYNIKKKLRETIYKLVYLAIKLELIYKEESDLLKYISLSEINTSYVEEIIIREIESLDLTTLDNKEINQRLKELQMKGLNFSYLDNELIKLLSNIQDSKEQNLNIYFNQFLEYYEELEKLLTQIDKTTCKENLLEEEQLKAKKHNKFYLKSGMKKSFALIGYLTIMTSTTVGLNTATKKHYTYKKYSTTIEKYDITNKKILPSETIYEDSTKDRVSITKYNPWIESSWWEVNISGWEKFTREVSEYDVSNIDYDSIEDYATLDLIKLGIKPTETREETESLVPSDLYEKPFTIVKRFIHNIEKYEEALKEDDYMGIMILNYSIVIGFDMLISTLYGKEFITGLIRDSIKDYKKCKDAKQIEKSNKKERLIYTREIKELTQKYNQLISKIEDKYKKLPKNAKELEEIKDIMKKVRKKV